jgi:hypothetical protein
MSGALVRRERRTLWGTLIPLIVVGIAACLYAASTSRDALVARAERDATVVAQNRLAPLLSVRDLAQPVTPERVEELAGLIEEEIIADGPVTSVRIYSAQGRILYDADPSVVTLKPTYLRGFLDEVTSEGTRSEVRSGLLQTYVPLRLASGGGTAVAELSQAFGPLAADARMPWIAIVAILGLLLVATIILYVLSARATTPAPTLGVVQAHPAFRAAEEARLRAEQRATATEVAFKDLQGQFRKTLDELKAMEASVTMHENETTGSDDEIQALRDQLRDTAERLQQAELDNRALRERLTARQTELEEQRARLAKTLERTPREELDELRRRVEIAERHATEMEAEVERIEAELDYTANRFHMAKLTEALREFDNDGAAPEDEDILEHPKVIFQPDPSVVPGKVR